MAFNWEKTGQILAEIASCGTGKTKADYLVYAFVY